MFSFIRNEIYNTANSRKHLIPDVTIETTNGNMKIHDYIDSIKLDMFLGGDFELSIAYDIYSFNIAQYKAIFNNQNEIIGYQFISYYNNDNNEFKNLMLIT